MKKLSVSLNNFTCYFMHVSRRKSLRTVKGGDFGASLKTSGQRQPIRISISDVERPNFQGIVGLASLEPAAAAHLMT